MSQVLWQPVCPSPVQIADVTTTTTHKTLGGPVAGLILAKANEEIEKKLNFAVFPESQGGPLMHVIAAKAVCFKEAMEDSFKTYQQRVVKNAQAMVQVFMKRGYDIVSKGTDDHLFLVDLINKNITGKDADAALGRANITVNKTRFPMIRALCDQWAACGHPGDYPSRIPGRASHQAGRLDV